MAWGLGSRLPLVCWVVGLACLHCRQNTHSPSTTIVYFWGLWPARSLETLHHSHSLWAQDPKFSSFPWIPICHCDAKLLLWVSPLPHPVSSQFPVLFSGGGRSSPGSQWGIGYLSPSSWWLWSSLPFLCWGGAGEGQVDSQNFYYCSVETTHKKISRHREGHYIMMEGSVSQEGTTVVNVDAQNHTAANYVKQNWWNWRERQTNPQLWFETSKPLS